jgi:hypothetical protein
MIKEHIAANRDANFQRKQNSALLRAQKKQERIAKLEEKLAKLRNPTGAVAVRQNRKPSKPVVTTFA